MKVVGFNGSPNKKGNTACSLNIVFEELENAGIETEMIHVGKKNTGMHCLSRLCKKTK